MKKLLFILAIALSSCTAESARQEEQNCNCETVLTVNVFTLPNGYKFTTVTLANDCTGAQRQEDLQGSYSVGQKICN